MRLLNQGLGLLEGTVFFFLLTVIHDEAFSIAPSPIDRHASSEPNSLNILAGPQVDMHLS